MRTVLAVATAALLVGCSNQESGHLDEIRGLEPTSSQERPAAQNDPEILAAVKAMPDLARFNFKLLQLDVQGNFALASLEATGENLDPLTVLLGRDEGKWKVLDYGTAIGDPRDFGVPDKTAKRWDF